MRVSWFAMASTAAATLPYWSMRPLEAMSGFVLPPLPRLFAAKPQRVLEIGCGNARALRQAAVQMATLSPDNEVCSVGLTLFKYTEMMLESSRTSKSSLNNEALRARGMSALHEDGLMHTNGVLGLQKRFAIQNSTAPPPIIIDHDYNYGLPFRAESFDLVLSQAALKWRDRTQVPDKNVLMEDSFRFILDEVARTMRDGGSAFINLGAKLENSSLSSAMLGKRSGAIDGSPTQRARHPNWWPAYSGAEEAWLERQKSAHFVPIELAVGSMTLVRGSGDGCFTPCKPTCASDVAFTGRHADSPLASNRSYARRSCVAYLISNRGGVRVAALGSEAATVFIQRFEPGGDHHNGGACLQRALDLPLVKSFVRMVPGTLVKEHHQTSSSIVSELRKRAAERHDDLTCTQVLKGTQCSEIDPMISAVRLWLRDPRRCHALLGSLGTSDCEGQPQITWSGLHVFQPSL